MAIYQVKAPDGSILKIQGPDNATDEQLVQAAQAAFSQRPQSVVSVQQPEPKEGGFGQTLGNLAAGAVRGAGSIGATLLAPIDAAARAVGVQNSFIGRDDRREAMTGALREMGAQPDSLAFQAGKIGAEVAGTLPVGGVLAKGVGAIAPGATGLATALRAGGMAGPNLATRIAGGAATGAAAAGLVNPEDAGTGAIIGGVLPVIRAGLRGATAAARNVIGATTGVGDEALRTAYAAGRSGGPQAQALRENMRGQTSMLDVLDDAKANLETIRQARSAAYRQNMANVQASQKVLDMQPIDESVSNALKSFTFKGQAKNPKVAEALQSVSDEVAAWRQLDPAEFHTAEGLDALKQRIGAIRESLPFEARSSRAAVDGVYNSIKRQIEAEAPEYATAMRDYTQASDLIDEITRSLSLNDRATADTAMRKLQSVMRNNVNTNYGARAAAMQALEQQGGRDLVPALAGQSLNDWMPRGIQRATGALGTVGAGSIGGIPAAAGMAAISSPRLMGEAAYLTGSGARVASPLVQALRTGAYRAGPVLGAQ